MSYKQLLILLLPILSGCTTLQYADHTCAYQPPMPQIKKPKIAFVLGGGGAKGLAHVGVMEVLLEAGIKPDLIVGCSSGAIVGALYADTLDIHAVKNQLMEKRREHLLDITLSTLPFGISQASALRQFLERTLQAKTYESLKIPFVCIATNLEYGDLTVFGTGLLEPTIRASASFPGVFIPVKIEDQYFVDGGVADPLPVQVARQLGAQYVIAIDLAGELVETKPNHVLGVLKRSLEISYLHHSKMAASEADFIIKIPFKDIGTFDDGVNEKIYQLGRESGKKALSALKEKLKYKKTQ